MTNASIAKITGQPLNLSKGQTTRTAPVSGPSACGCGKFSPRAGANKQGKYIVDGVTAYGSSGKG
ncbi:MAG: hypothetical protein DRI24_01675 [Deltaproteobacteria bacterium]|nr:MAG: hypothetical protein DRI24_01675 [Deltaproteobacteria bacterium]